ncbi:geranylgeranyl diphosphate synthase type I [Streptacidiphilus sp. MAP12-33]|uniref:polyprenyl synthetase family protein n=1 Tax=Streptacidiphilus sp. MAP12-33 TaxID=3156266 RepID=UPI00351171C7
MSNVADVTVPDLVRIREAVDGTLGELIAAKRASACAGLLDDFFDVLTGFLASGGRRARPLFCCLGWRAVDGLPETPEVLRAAASLELLHTYAMIHDDIIDRSDVRHQQPTVHRAFALRHPGPRADWLGGSAALLLGNLCAAWASEGFNSLPPNGRTQAARSLFDEMCTELIAGEYQDVRGFQDSAADVEHALSVVHHKTTSYSIERPLQIGAALAGGGRALQDACSAYARPVGEAFQMLNDLDDVAVGSDKIGEDIRTGKHTVVLTLARQKLDRAPAQRLRALMGDPDLTKAELEEARALIEASGAPTTVRRMIDERLARSEDVLARAPFHPSVRRPLQLMIEMGKQGHRA